MSGHRAGATVSQRRFRAAAVAVLVVLVVLLGVALRPGAAAHLPVHPVSMTSLSLAERCTQAVATNTEATAGQATSVVVTGLGAECGGLDLDLTLYGQGGTALTSVTTTLAADASDSATVSVPAYAPADVAGAAVTIGTWGVPATWTHTPSVPLPLVTCTVLNDPTGTKTCEATDVRIDSWGYPTPNNYNLYATVRSPSATADVEWQVTINLAGSELPFTANHADSNNAVALAPGWGCSSMPTLELRGQSGPDTQFVGGEKTVTIWLHGKYSTTPATGNLFTCF